MSHILERECTPPAKPHICWLGGWGISEHAMLATAQHLLPQAEHTAFAPTEASLAILRARLAHSTATPVTDANGQQNHDQQPHIFAGYSTGAFLLLRELGQTEALLTNKQMLLLFAPFADFRAEGGLGGRVATARLKLLLRRLRNDPLSAVADFYQQSGIGLEPPAELPYAPADLIWGIEQLAQTAVSPQALARAQESEAQLKIRAWIGTHDALLEAQKISTLFAPGVCRIAQDASHSLASLLAAANAEGALLP